MATNSRVSGLKVVEYSGKDQIPSPLAKSKISFLVSGTMSPNNSNSQSEIHLEYKTTH